MARRRSNQYYSSYGREKSQRLPNPLPYLIVLAVAAAGLAYFNYFVYRSLSGSVVNAYSGAAMPNVPVLLMQVPESDDVWSAPGAVLTTTTAADGTFEFGRVSARPAVSVTFEGYAPQFVDAAEKDRVEIELVPSTLGGRVTSSAGEPVAGARIQVGKAITATAQDGSYLLTDAPGEGQMSVKAPGYLASSLDFRQSITQNVTLAPFSARAIYISADTAASPTKLRGLLDMIERTELNAVVIDVKADNSGAVLYNSTSPEVVELGTAQSIIGDLDALLAEMQRRDIYTIARLSVFWDQALTGAKPDLALKSKGSPGQAWMDAYGKRWANPHDTRVWDYNIAIAEEVARRGFDEVQFDIAYFPANGDLRDIDFGAENEGKPDVEAIAGFLDRAHNRLSGSAAYVSVDVLGLTPFVPDDMGVGQQYDELARRVDYVSPFVYPSDFQDGFLDFAKPAENPADVVANSVRNAVRRAGDGKKVRPWLQDFSREVQYDAAKVRAQIDAAEASGAGGWMLWNFDNVYTEPALKAP